MSSRFHHTLIIAAMAALSIATASAAARADSPAPSPAPTVAPTANPVNPSYPPVTTPANPRSASASQLLAAARADADRGDNEGAAEKLHKAVALEPRNIEIERTLGDVEYRLQHYQAAEAAYLAVLAIDPTNRDVYNRLGGVYSAEDRFDDAVSAFRKSLPSKEGFANLVMLYADEGRLGELESEYKLEETRNPYEPSNHYNLA